MGSDATAGQRGGRRALPAAAISLFLTKRQEFAAIASIITVGVAAVLFTTLPRIIGDARLL